MQPIVETSPDRDPPQPQGRNGLGRAEMAAAAAAANGSRRGTNGRRPMMKASSSRRMMADYYYDDQDDVFEPPRLRPAEDEDRRESVVSTGPMGEQNVIQSNEHRILE